MDDFYQYISDSIKNFLNGDGRVLHIVVPTHELGVDQRQYDNNYRRLIQELVNTITLHIDPQTLNNLLQTIEVGNTVRRIRDGVIQNQLYRIVNIDRERNCCDLQTIETRRRVGIEYDNNPATIYGVSMESIINNIRGKQSDMQAIYELANNNHENNQQYSNALILQCGGQPQLNSASYPTSAEIANSPIIYANTRNADGYLNKYRPRCIDVMLFLTDAVFKGTKFTNHYLPRAHKVIYIGTYFEKDVDRRCQISREQMARWFDYKLPDVSEYMCDSTSLMKLFDNIFNSKEIIFEDGIQNKIKRIILASLSPYDDNLMDTIFSLDELSLDEGDYLRDHLQPLKEINNQKLKKLEEILESESNIYRRGRNIYIVTSNSRSFLTNRFKGENVKIIPHISGFKRIISNIVENKAKNNDNNLFIFDTIYKDDNLIEYMLYRGIKGHFYFLYYQGIDRRQDDNRVEDPYAYLRGSLSTDWFYAVDSNDEVETRQSNAYRITFDNGVVCDTVGDVLIYYEDEGWTQCEAGQLRKGQKAILYSYDRDLFEERIRGHISQNDLDQANSLSLEWKERLRALVNRYGFPELIEKMNQEYLININRTSLKRYLSDNAPMFPSIKYLKQILRMFAAEFNIDLGEKINEYTKAKNTMYRRRQLGAQMKADLFRHKISDNSFTDGLFVEGNVQSIRQLNNNDE